MTWGWWGEGRDFLLHTVHICTNLHMTSQALPLKCQSFSGQEVVTALLWAFKAFSHRVSFCVLAKLHPPLPLPQPHPTSPLSWQRLSEGGAEVPAGWKPDQGSSEDPRILPDATDAAGG